MGKKQKKRTPRGGENRHKTNTSALEQEARAALESGRWRDAIADFKELLKREPRPEWRTALADAYAGRAGELTAKGMLKEALAIWENRAALHDKAPMHLEHAGLLVRLGRMEAVVGALTDNPDSAGSDALAAGQRESLRAQIAAQVVGGHSALLAQLPADDPVRLHAEPALAALHAYCEGRDDDLRAALSAIPFRSPYRDWVQLLKVLQRQTATEPDASQGDAKPVVAQLERVSDSSPFAPLKRALALAVLPDRAFADGAGGATGAEFQVACALRGWPPERLALWQELNRLGPKPGSKPAPRALAKTLYRHIKDLGRNWVRRKALTLAFNDAVTPTSVFDFDIRANISTWLRECGAPALTTWERELVSAWDAEVDTHGDPFDLIECWRECAQLQMFQSEEARDAQSPLRIALILRRTDRVLKVLERCSASQEPDAFELAVAEQLEESLRWDPDDRATYLKLIEFFRKARQLKDARRVLELGQKRWPRDLPLMIEAMQTALDGGAFKKAATLAKKVLEIDPINTDVRRRLVGAHFLHAHKQVGNRRLDLARKELVDAQEWASNDEDKDQLSLGLVLVDAMDRRSTDAALAELKARYGGRGDSLDARVELALACARVRVQASDVFRLLSLNKSKGRGREDLLAALGRLRRHLEDNSPISDDLAATLQKKVFNAAPWRDLSRAELETACDTLQRFGQHLACQKAAEAALKQWPREPIFVMYQFQGKYPRGFDYRRRADLSELEDAWQRARDGGDTRTAIRIEKVLPHGPPLRGNFPMPPMFFDDDDEDEEDEFWPDDPFDVPPPVFDSLDAGEMLSSDAVRHMIESIGPVKVMEMLGAPKSVIREAKEMEKALGRQAVIDMVLNAIQGGVDASALLGDSPFPGPGDSEPPSTGSSKARSRSKPKTGSGAKPKPPSKQATKPGSSADGSGPSSDGPNDPPPKQLDLF
ncbi:MULTISPECIES: tetratricopeptide repeat protein [Thiorhodovibrio]|uniref:tetratricopeptide repeat protein n=1 Tax=Thiorhodovibrio TaxID=61593 RepID=UPI001914B795|nr:MULTISPECIES: hypothetical protein [Thiorhodovibrio]MBK5969952.1 hypothetical protein [Thiorhodovibrio winogradskyi]WPL12875.1 hypothetical protein Thiosp_02655 [Thiorhodovibrio litoralis]